MADSVVTPSNSSEGGSQTLEYVGDVDERTSGIAEINKESNENQMENDGDSFVVVDESDVVQESHVSVGANADDTKEDDADADLDLDALLDDSINGNSESDMNHDGEKDADSSALAKPSEISEDAKHDQDLDALLDDSFDGNDGSGTDDKYKHHDQEIKQDPLEEKSSDVPETSVRPQDKEASELDSILGDDGIDGSSDVDVDEAADTKQEITKTENSENATSEYEAFSNPDSSDAAEDVHALELDALLDDPHEEEDRNIDLEAVEGKAQSEVTSKIESNDAIVTEDVHALELDALLDDPREEEGRNVDLEVVEEKNPSEDVHALELDALLDDPHEDNANADLEVVEEKAPRQAASKVKNHNDSLVAPGTKTTSKASNGGGRILSGLSSRVGTPGRGLVVSRTKTPAKKSTGSMSNISSSVSDTFTNSKKKVMTARDRMKEYSRGLSSRASNQMKKTTRNFRREASSNEKETMPKSTWGESWSKAASRDYMKSTAAFTNYVVESHNDRQKKTRLKEIDERKTVVDMEPWKTKAKTFTAKLDFKPVFHTPNRKPITSGTVSSITRVASALVERKQRAEEREREMQKSSLYSSPGDGDKATPFSLFISPQRHKSPKTESIIFSDEASNDPYHTPRRSFCAQSVGSLSSLCTVESYVNPVKEGILGCQNKYNPFLHAMRGPCELCVFRLSDDEKEELDANGRHLMVQFTRGGCQNCSAFPKSDDEPPVRLCPKCYTTSHRRIEKTYGRKKRSTPRNRYYGRKENY